MVRFYARVFQDKVHGAKLFVDHSTAGAIEASNRRNPPAAFCIAGHHTGLPDWGSKADAVPESATLKGRLSRKVGRDIEDYSSYKDEIDEMSCAIPPEFNTDSETLAFFIRMLFSCLVDADWLDTEAYMKQGGVRRGEFAPLDEYERRLETKLSSWLTASSVPLTALRNEILLAAQNAAALSPGLFSLTAPTGSGKTWASMAFALAHALKHKKRRIIYVIPYCSIIDQTHEEFEKVFGSGSVVAHYANVEYKNPEDGDDKRYLAAENWDAPVILTTTVQFFESLYANRPSRCRKLHNIANSVIIFDEAQMLPVPFLRPCVNAIAQLVAHYGCSALLCTATQPVLTPLFSKVLAAYPIREICPRPLEMYRLFRRVRYKYLGVLSDEALASRLSAIDRVLCVVNSREQAQALFDALPKEGRFHLSATMDPSLRRECLTEIKKRLDDKEICRVVSTSLVEAGVNLDFPAVYRALAGLDSIIQAGGRSARNEAPGILSGVVYIFESERPSPRMMAQNISCTRAVLARFSDPASPEAIAAYFQDLLYVAKGTDALDEKRIVSLLESGTYPFREIAEKFVLIDDDQRTVYIRCPKSEALLERLSKNGPDRKLMRELGAFSIGVSPRYYKKLICIGAVREIADGAGILEDGRLYNRDKGLLLNIQE